MSKHQQANETPDSDKTYAFNAGQQSPNSHRGSKYYDSDDEDSQQTLSAIIDKADEQEKSNQLPLQNVISFLNNIATCTHMVALGESHVFKLSKLLQNAIIP